MVNTILDAFIVLCTMVGFFVLTFVFIAGLCYLLYRISLINSEKYENWL